MIVEDDGSHKNTTENGHQDCNVAASKPPLSIPTIHIEMSEPSEQFNMPSNEPQKLNRVDKPLLRTPRVAGSNRLLVQHDTSITFGSPKLSKRRTVERTLSADSYHNHPRCDSSSPALSIKSSRASSVDRSRSRVSSGSRRSANYNYSDDFDESSDVDEGCAAYFVFA